jgi:hypothetical protein
MNTITPAFAKRVIQTALANHGLMPKLSARTISFADLARDSMIFVRIHWPQFEPLGNPSCYAELRALAVSNGFRIEVQS